MAHYRALFIGNPDNIYNDELNLFDDGYGNSGQLADYGSMYDGLYVNNEYVSSSIASNIDWSKSHSISVIFREDNKETYIGCDGVGSPVVYNNNEEMLQYINPQDQCTILNIHL